MEFEVDHLGTANNVRLLRVDNCNNENEILIKFHGSFGLSWLGGKKLDFNRSFPLR